MEQSNEHLPVPASDDELEVLMNPEGLLVSGDPATIESYLERLREVAGRAVQVVGVDRSTISNAAGLAAGAVTLVSESGKFVQLHPDSVTALKVGKWIPGTDGFFRMTTRTSDGAFLQQLQWKPTALGPTQLMTLEMVAMQIALRAAIAEVENAINRVEGKVDDLLRLAGANRSGDVLGSYRTIKRTTKFVEKHAVLPDADWDAISSMGPTLSVTVEQLRNYVTRLLQSFDTELPVQDRARKLRQAVDEDQLGEALSLLVIAEESLHSWQWLRFSRVEAGQPQHRERVYEDARDLIREQLAEDGKMYSAAKRILDDFAKPEAIEGFRYFSVRELAKQRAKLRGELDSFAQARRHQIEDWQSIETPSVLDAAEAAIDAAMESASKSIGRAGRSLIRLSEYMADKKAEDKPEGHDVT